MVPCSWIVWGDQIAWIVINLGLFCNWLELRVVLGFKNENVHLFSNIMFNRHL